MKEKHRFMVFTFLSFVPSAICLYAFIYAYSWQFVVFFSISVIMFPIGLILIASLNKILKEEAKALSGEKNSSDSRQFNTQTSQTNSSNPTPASQMKGSIYVVDGEMEALDKKWREENRKRLKQEKDVD